MTKSSGNYYKDMWPVQYNSCGRKIPAVMNMSTISTEAMPLYPIQGIASNVPKLTFQPTFPPMITQLIPQNETDKQCCQPKNRSHSRIPVLATNVD